MKLAIVGGRNLSPDIEPHLPEGVTCIVSGGAKGVDTLAAELAERLGLELIVFKPDYKRYGRGAPIVRNQQIIDEADEVLAFWDGKSKGTKSSIDKARKAGKPCKVVFMDNGE